MTTKALTRALTSRETQWQSEEQQHSPLSFDLKTGPPITSDTGHIRVDFYLSKAFRFRVRGMYGADGRTDIVQIRNGASC